MTVAGHGIAVDAPSGWDVRIYRRPAQPPETTHPILHAGTFPLPANCGDYGDGAVQVMGPADVFVALVQFATESLGRALFAAHGFPPPLQAADFSRTTLQVGLPGQAGAQRFFTAGGSPWSLYAVIGSWARRDALAARANALVAGIGVGR